MITKKELERWLSTLPNGVDLFIDDGGLTLQSECGAYLEIGGDHEGDCDDNEEEAPPAGAPGFTPGPWVVLADPEFAGRHPFHDQRYIATADTVFDPPREEGAEHEMTAGSLICVMRDGPRANADLIAAAPAMFAALVALLANAEDKQKLIDNMNGDETFDAAGAQIVADSPEMGRARDLIASVGRFAR